MAHGRRVAYLWSLLVFACLSVAAQEPEESEPGYRLLRDRVTVAGGDQWEGWESPPGVRVIEADGTVRPRFLRRDIDAVANAGQFMRVEVQSDTIYGGISAAGTHLETAANAIDGDPDSYWEPSRQDPLEKWYIEIDLGRAVIAQRIVVRFVEKGKGDPFLKFRLMVSDGRRVFGENLDRQFFRVAQVTARNKEQREFSFDVLPLRPVPEGVTGEIVQFVRLDALDSDGARGHEVSEEEYRTLPAEDRGAVDFFRVTVAGREIPVLPETYNRLPDSEKGPVRFYRYERPRLAEVEVYAPGDNVVTLTQRELFQDQSLFSNLLRRQLTDGFHFSSFDLREYDPIKDSNQFDVDLGAKYWLSRIRLLSPGDPPIAYQVRISDGSIDPNGGLLWKTFDERLNLEGFLQLEESFPLQEVRHIEVRRLKVIGATTEQVTLSEVQAYGEGYVSEVQLISPLIRLGTPRIFSSVSWEGDAPPETQIEVRTRSGDDLLQIHHYYDRYGREISEERWVNITNKENRGPVVLEEFPGPKWSTWSEVYQTSGGGFRSPNPRQMVQVQVRLLSDDPLRAATLRRLQLNFTNPLVERVQGEIWPVRDVLPGVDQEFTLYLHPEFAAGDSGFDRLVLRSSSSAVMELVELRAGADEILQRGGGEVLWPGRVETAGREDGSLELIFPQTVRGGEAVYLLKFRTRVFLNSTTFSVEMHNATRPDIAQMASEGDASIMASSQSLIVVTDLREAPLLSNFALNPPIFTPNGDGINESAQIDFSVFRLEGEQRFLVQVFALDGRLVRDLSFVRANPSGNHRLSWDGRDEGGRLLPPGIYLLRVSFDPDADRNGTDLVTPVHVIY